MMDVSIICLYIVCVYLPIATMHNIILLHIYLATILIDSALAIHAQHMIIIMHTYTNIIHHHVYA